jgi:hypothetical protein
MISSGWNEVDVGRLPIFPLGYFTSRNEKG